MSSLLSYRILLRAEWYTSIIDLEQRHASILRKNAFSSLPLFLLKDNYVLNLQKEKDVCAGVTTKQYLTKGKLFAQNMF
jgi:hypothetical protein